MVFVSMDAAEHRLPFEGYDLGDAIKLRSFEAGNHRAIYFRNVTGSATLKALAHKGALTTEALGKFLGTVSLEWRRKAIRQTRRHQEGHQYPRHI